MLSRVCRSKLRPGVLLAFVGMASVLPAGPACSDELARSDAAVRRVVSLNPSLTAMLLALGAGDRIVGVDDYSSSQRAEVAHLPSVGGLFNPSLEGVVALEPDLVVLVPSAEQRDFRERVESLGIRVAVFENIRFEQVVENITRMGELVGQRDVARRRVGAIRRTRRVVEDAVRSLPRPRVLVVLQRDPLYVVGGGSFLDEMLEAVGATNLGAELDDPYPRASVEWLVASAPEVLIDMTPDRDDPSAYWSRWPTLPAVAGARVLRLDPAQVSLPGPYLDRSLELLAAAIHGSGLALSRRPQPEAALREPARQQGVAGGAPEP